MIKIFRSLFLLAFLSGAQAVHAQRYKTIGDTARLNKEYVNLRNDIALLSAKLTIAENDLPGYQAKAKDADHDAASAAEASSDQASKATNGKVSDARTAKRRAKKAYNEARDSRQAKSRLNSHEDKITRYKVDIRKKEQRIEELDLMRSGIDAKITADSVRRAQQ